MSLTPPEKIEKLQRVLRTKAKEAPDYRFYALHDKMYREDVLDGQHFKDIEAYGVQRWLGELAQGAWQTVQQHTCRRLRWWLHRRSGERSESKRFCDVRLYTNYGLVKLVDTVPRSFL